MSERLSDEKVREMESQAIACGNFHHGMFNAKRVAALAREVLELREALKNAPKVTPLLSGLALRTSPDIEAGAFWANLEWLAEQTDTSRVDRMLEDWLAWTATMRATPAPHRGETP